MMHNESNVSSDITSSILYLKLYPVKWTYIDEQSEQIKVHEQCVSCNPIYKGLSVLARYAKLIVISPMLSYTGWVNGHSLTSKIWGGILYLMLGGSPYPAFYFDPIMPKLPLNNLEDTIKDWIETTSHLLSLKEHRELVERLQEFTEYEAPMLQRNLNARYRDRKNWYYQYWMRETHLCKRESLMGFSNFVYISKTTFTENQVARAANITRLICQFFEMLKEGVLPASVVEGNRIPLCMQTYKFLFNSARSPGHIMDKILIADQNNCHIIVIRHNHFFKLRIYRKESKTRILLNPIEFESQLKDIIFRANVIDDDNGIAYLTSQDRTSWSKHRRILERRNKPILQDIESALFVLTLSTEKSSNKDGSFLYKEALCGDGNYWFDKGLSCCVFADSTFSMMAEKSIIDPMVLANLKHYVMSGETYDNIGELPDSDNQLMNVLQPIRHLEWNTTDVFQFLEQAKINFFSIKNNLCIDHLTIKFGKRDLDSLRVPPGPFVQMVIQLAYYRLHKHFTKTIEPISNRLFHNGRVDYIHTVSKASKTFVYDMMGDVSYDHLRQSLINSICHHNDLQLAATRGLGFNKHLQSLKCMAEETTRCTFPHKVFSTKAYTSAAGVETYHLNYDTHRILDKFRAEDFLNVMGPSNTGAYSINYSFVGEHTINLSICTWKECSMNNCEAMKKELQVAFHETSELLKY